MHNDAITLRDLSVFTNDNDNVFTLLDHTTSHVGRTALKKLIRQPPDNPGQLLQYQEVVRFWTEQSHAWPQIISNGTLVMLDKFFESPDREAAPKGWSLTINTFMQKIFNRNEYFFSHFSIGHLSDFLKGCEQLTLLLEQDKLPQLLQQHLEDIATLIQDNTSQEIIRITKTTSKKTLAYLSYRARRELKNSYQQLEYLYGKLDAWQSLAKATLQHGWSFPEIKDSSLHTIEAKGLYHPLLSNPVAYDIQFNREQNFLLLTGANMSGKTTFMRALGVCSLLAHLGCGVPAKSLSISFLNGIITNMHVEDNLLKGESYFYAEVLRMKATAQKLREHQSYIVLMDELFKGTNVHDAYECTRAIVEGLLNKSKHIIILSTHLYEVALHFKDNPHLHFAYFETQSNEAQPYLFTYQLKSGISNDRIGYKILQKEGVIDLLK